MTRRTMQPLTRRKRLGLVVIALGCAITAAACSASAKKDARPTVTSVRTVVVQRGAATAKPECADSSCAHVRVRLAGFASGSHTIHLMCDAPACGPSNDLYTYTSADNDSEVGFYGYPNTSVWALVDGVESNHLNWSQEK